MKFLKRHGEKKRNRNWVRVKAEKIFLEPNSDRYFILLKPEKSGSEVLALQLGQILDEQLMASLFMKNESLPNWILRLGIKIQKIRIHKKVDSTEAAECVFKMGWRKKTVRVSHLEAIRLAIESGVTMEVPGDMLEDSSNIGVSAAALQASMLQNPFTTKFIERDWYPGSEVVM